jgi:hypothetical protein
MTMLPSNPTATDVIDLLSEQMMQFVTNVNSGRELTRAQFAAAFEHAFTTALPVFLDELEHDRPELASQLRTQFLQEQEARIHAEAVSGELD